MQELDLVTEVRCTADRAATKGVTNQAAEEAPAAALNSQRERTDPPHQEWKLL
jgi:hypothetical protein